jgi:hypothetical protein
LGRYKIKSLDRFFHINKIQEDILFALDFPWRYTIYPIRVNFLDKSVIKADALTSPVFRIIYGTE